MSVTVYEAHTRARSRYQRLARVQSCTVYIVTFASFATVVKSEYARNKDVVERAMNSHFLDTL